MLCPNCDLPLTAITPSYTLECGGCRRQWLSASLVVDIAEAITNLVQAASFPVDATDISVSCGSCGGTGLGERYVNPEDPSEGFESVQCADCTGTGRRL